MQDFTAVIAVFLIFGAPIAAWIVSRVLRHQEHMEYLRRGMVPPPSVGGRAFRRWYREMNQAGPAGQAVPPWQTGAPMPPPRAARYCGPDDDPQRALAKGIQTAMIGLAILIGLSFIGGTPGTSDFHGGPWLLGGLIPMFVGIAMIISALLAGAQLPGGTRTTFVPPPPPGPGPGGPQAPQDIPWHPGSAWHQPGRPHFEELSKPAPPPDKR
ncbi:MAG TPA: hypothetical protein VMD91_19415 [Candidatus Sulfotelmatobacter sp.]|nr:hypothetical protein [Candidatus Sulfotelmatobacter sp.]